jgi:hypothetical protein
MVGFVLTFVYGDYESQSVRRRMIERVYESFRTCQTSNDTVVV